MTAKKYPSSVSYGLLFFIFLVFYGPIIPDLINEKLNIGTIVFVSLLSLLFAFILHLFLGTYYTIKHNQLEIKCGFFSYRAIDINQIKEVAKTKNIMASPAPSFDRIVVKYGKSEEIILSPKEKLCFVNDLKKINPNIQNNLNK